MTPDEREKLTALADQRRAAVADEYASFVAAQDITHNGVVAYAAGQAVPTSNVRAHGYLTAGLVITADQARAEREAAVKAAAEAEAAREAEIEAAWQEAQAGSPAETAEPEPKSKK